jgi:hypothetical protein
MALMQKKTAEEKAQEAELKAQRRRDTDARKEQERREAQARKRVERIDQARQAFFGTPAGRARLAFERGDQVFQYEIDVMNQQAIIISMVGSTTSKKTSDPTEILNSVCHEGWELVNGSFVFVEQGQQSRDKFLASGQNVAIKGTTVGYYLFKRCEQNRRPPTKPWEEATIGEEATTEQAIVLFERGDLELSAKMMREIRYAAESEQALADADRVLSEMRDHLDPGELQAFNNAFIGSEEV